MSQDAEAAPDVSPADVDFSETPETDTTDQSAEKAPEPKPEPRKFKLKIEGKEEELPEEEVVKYAQIGKAGQKRLDEAARIRKEAEQKATQAQQLLEFLKANPKEAMKQLGLDPRKVSEDLLYEILEEEALTPEQKRLREAEAKLKAFEDEKRQAEEKANAEKLAAETDAFVKDVNEKLGPLCEAEGLKLTPHALARIAQLGLINDEQGLDVPLETLVKQAKEGIVSDVRNILTNLDGEAVLGILGDEIAKKIRKADLARLKGAASAPKQEPKTLPKRNKPPTREEYLARIEALKAQARDEDEY